MTPRQQQHSARRAKASRAQTDELSEETLRELLFARREMLRWKTIAKQNEAYIQQIKCNSPLLYALMRIIPEIKQHWKLLLLLTVGTFATIPVWLLMLVVIIFPKGRKLLWALVARVTATFPECRVSMWSLSEKLGSSNGLWGRTWLKLMQGRGLGRGEYNKIAPLIYERPTTNNGVTAGSSINWNQWDLLQQLSPQKRFFLQRFDVTQKSLMHDSEARELVSTSRAEISLIKVALAKNPTEALRTVYS
jgi:hypothetical protein